MFKPYGQRHARPLFQKVLLLPDHQKGSGSMRHYLLFAAMLVALSGCDDQPPPITPVITLEQIDSQQCVTEGFQPKSDEYNQCMDEEQKEREEAQKAAEAKAEKEAREQVKREKAYAAKMKREQLVADKAKCDDYSIKRGTRDFSACLVYLDQLRQQRAEQGQAAA